MIPEHPGNFIKRYCKSHGWTQSEFARKLEMSRGYINRLLNEDDLDLPGSMMLKLGEITEHDVKFWADLQDQYRKYRDDPDYRKKASIDDLKNAFELRGPRVLVDQEIQMCCEKGFISIDPYHSQNLQPATYDLTIGAKAVIVDHVNKSETVVDTAEVRDLESGKVAFLQTEETVTLPDQILGRIGPTANLVRQGAFFSIGPQVDPGFSGKLFVAVENRGIGPISIVHQEPFLSIEFTYVVTTPLSRIDAKSKQDLTAEPLDQREGNENHILLERERALIRRELELINREKELINKRET